MFRIVRAHVLLLAILLIFISLCDAKAQEIPADDLLGKQIRQFSIDTAYIYDLINTAKRNTNNADSGIVLLNRALSLSKDINYVDGYAAALLGIGTCYFNKGELEESKKYFRQAYPYCQNAVFKKRELLLSWYNDMASPFAVQGNTDTATYYYYKALNLVAGNKNADNKIKRQDSSLAAIVLSNLGNVWLKAAQYKQSLYYSGKALEIAKALNDSDQIANIYENMGLAYDSSVANAASLQALRTAYAIHLKRKNYMGAQMDCCAIAINFSEPDSALYYYRTALALSRLTAMEPLHKIYIGLGYTYMQAAQYDSAAYYLKKGLDRASALNFKNDLTFIYSGLAQVYTAQGNFELANKYQKAYSDLRDSLLNNQKIISANALEVKYRTAEKDREIARAQLQLVKRDYTLKQKNYFIFFIVSAIVILAVILVAMYRSARRKVKYEQQKRINLEQTQQITQLKSVMAGEEKERTRIARELHDGIMVQLAVIKMKLRKARTQSLAVREMEEILEQIDNTSRELRQTAHNLMPDMLLETGLTDALFYYCNKLKKETGLNIIFQYYGQLPRLTQEAELYLYRIVQELMQNIIKHAHATKALIQMNYHPPLLSFAVEDNGTGFDKDAINEGMGLKSIYSRLRVLNGTIDIQSSSYTSTNIFIELNIESFILSKTTDNVHTGSNS